MRSRLGTGSRCGSKSSRTSSAVRLSGATRPTLRAPIALDPPPRRDILPRDSFLTTTSMIATRGCHNRCGFCYLSTEGLHMPYRMRDVDQVAGEILADAQPYTVFIDNNLGSRPDYLRRLCATLRPLEHHLECRRHDRRDG